MRGIALVLLLVGCGDAALPDAPIARPALPATLAKLPAPPKPVITSVPAAPVELIAVTDDGTAAITSDRTGSTRLWPTLDGTREPIVIHTASPPIDLAIAPTAAGFQVAFVDQTFDREAHALAEAQLDLAATAIYGTPHGILALTTDRALAFIDTANHATRLVTPERILQVVYRNGRALALHDAPKVHVRGRWISISRTGFALDGQTPDLEI
ncbi:MAG TPA: hypothetical protein VGC41_13175, partial [Kofleriaceae bacterium]